MQRVVLREALLKLASCFSGVFVHTASFKPEWRVLLLRVEIWLRLVLCSFFNHWFSTDWVILYWARIGRK
jgi:hypothetical protein